MLKRLTKLMVNGQEHEIAIAPHRTLLDVLREELNLTGTKKSCDMGECGACTVLLEGEPVLSCLILAIEAEGKEILTIEGLAQGGDLDPIQRAFIDHGAIQCGYCTPGMILSAKALFDRNPHPTRDEVEDSISGNLCRCTGYAKIVEAIVSVNGK